LTGHAQEHHHRDDHDRDALTTRPQPAEHRECTLGESEALHDPLATVGQQPRCQRIGSEPVSGHQVGPKPLDLLARPQSCDVRSRLLPVGREIVDVLVTTLQSIRSLGWATRCGVGIMRSFRVGRQHSYDLEHNSG